LLNLIETLEEIKRKVDKLEKEKQKAIDEVVKKYDKEIESYKNAYNVNLELNEACLNCRGSGKMSDPNGETGYESRPSYIKCTYCNGTGKWINHNSDEVFKY
jgi:superfamily II helicase